MWIHKVREIYFAVIGLILLALFSVSAHASYARRLQVVIVNDGANSALYGREDLRAGCDSNVEGILMMLRDGLGAAMGEPITLANYDSSPTQIRQTINSLQVGADVNIFFYYCGHGAWDNNVNYYFQMGQEGNLARDEVRGLLQARGAHGVIMTADACATVSDFKMSPQEPSTNQVLADLFLGASGVVDITSSSPGEPSWFNGDGGIYTTAFLKGVVTKRKDPNVRFTWSDAYVRIRDFTTSDFLALQNSLPANHPIHQAKGQTPASLYLEEQPSYQRRLLVQNTSGVAKNLSFSYQTQGANGWEWQTAQVEVPAGANNVLGKDGQAIYANSISYDNQNVISVVGAGGYNPRWQSGDYVIAVQ